MRDDSSDDWPDGIPEELVGESDVTIALDERQHERLRQLYQRAVASGYSDGFAAFALNNTDDTMTVTVNGDEVELETGERLDDGDDNCGGES